MWLKLKGNLSVKRSILFQFSRHWRIRQLRKKIGAQTFGNPFSWGRDTSIVNLMLFFNYCLATRTHVVLFFNPDIWKCFFSFKNKKKQGEQTKIYTKKKSDSYRLLNTDERILVAGPTNWLFDFGFLCLFSLTTLLWSKVLRHIDGNKLHIEDTRCPETIEFLDIEKFKCLT